MVGSLGIWLILSFSLGFGAAGLVFFFLDKGRKKAWEQMDTISDQMKESFSSLSFEVLSKNSDHFLKLAHSAMAAHAEKNDLQLNSKKELIDEQIKSVRGDLSQIEKLMQSLEKDREQKFSELSTVLKFSTAEIGKLKTTAEQLNQVLSNRKERGQWGERMAEDILAKIGFVEGINYERQKTLAESPNRPDYSFYLPGEMKVSMDVKFPFDNYLRLAETSESVLKTDYQQKFLRDVRNRIKEVTGKNYMGADEETLDYVILFIPNEQVFSFILEKDQSILDDALKMKVVLCAPISLYAILSIIRQAMNNFRLEKNMAEAFALISEFHGQWENFLQEMISCGKKIDGAQESFHKLCSTRKGKLEATVSKIGELSQLPQSKREERSDPLIGSKSLEPTKLNMTI